MSFSDFKSVAQVQQAYTIKYDEADFIEPIDLKPSQLFIDEFEFNQRHIDISISEASRCENLLYPILREIYKSFVDRYTLWSHKTITFDSELTGTPDYLLATRSELGKTVLGLPIIAVVEAKQNDFLQGWGQCLAELVALQKINQNEETPVYGIVSDGEVWQFGKLVYQTFTKHRSSLTIADLNKLFGAIAFLLHHHEQLKSSPLTP